MESHQQLWERCLALVKQRVNRRIYDVWFSKVECESYDADTNTVVLGVPSVYVYEYLEQYQVPLLSEVLSSVFREGITLQYRIRKEQSRQPQAVEIPETSEIPSFAIEGARERLRNGLRHFLGDRAVWLPAYDQIADWLSDNKGRGLLCVGTSGLGKTLISEKVLPVILGRKIAAVSAMDLTARIDELMKERCVIVDDLGKEPVRRYGETDRSFLKLCDAAERSGILLIVTTNLSTTPVSDPLYPESIEQRYGKDVLSRLRATTKLIIFKGNDLRS